jgi:YVTN family beta-propeller protein
MYRTGSLIAAAVLLAASTAAGADPLELKQTIKFPGKTGNLDHLAVDVKGERLFVANKPNNSLDVIDLKSGKVIKQIPDQGKASGVAYSEELNRVFVGNGAGTCNAFDCGADYKLAFSAKLAKADNVNYHSGSKIVYVAHGDTISAVDAKSGDVKGKVTVPGSAHGFAIDEKTNKIYVSLTNPNQVGVIDLAKNELTDKFPIALAAGNSPLVFDAARGLLFVGCRKEPMVVVMDAKTGKELGGVAIPGDIDDLAFDAKTGRLFAICGAGAVAVIEKKSEKYDVVAKVETAKSARTATISPAGDRLFLGVPAQGAAGEPEVRVYAIKQ